MKARFLSLGLLITRVAIGFPLAKQHGWGKLQSLLAGSTGFPDPLHIGARASLLGTVMGEFVCACLLVAGLGTRVAAGGIVFTMSVVLFVVGKGQPLFKNEMAYLYAVVPLALMFTGPGTVSLDALLAPRLRVILAARAPKPLARLFRAAPRN